MNIVSHFPDVMCHKGFETKIHTPTHMHEHTSLLTTDHTDAVSWELFVVIDPYIIILTMLYLHYLVC